MTCDRNACRKLILAAVAYILISVTASTAQPGQPGDKAKKPAVKSPDVELRLADNSTIKGVLVDDQIAVQTRYGKLSVPVADIQRIEFSPRLSPDEAKKLEAALAALAGPSEKQREGAVADLISLKEMSYPAVVRAGRSSNHELAARAREVLGRLREALGEERLSSIRDEDLIHTEGFTIVGRVETPVLRFRSSHFGELQLKLTDVRGLRSTALVVSNPGPTSVESDPGSLTNYEAQVGKVFHFRVTGAANGSLWGTETYTTDSTLAAAAVHAGVLKVGQTGVVKVTLLPSPLAFIGTTQNGITSSNYGTYRAAYRVSKP